MYDLVDALQYKLHSRERGVGTSYPLWHASAPARQQSVTRELRRILIGTMVLNRELLQLSQLPGLAVARKANRVAARTTGGSNCVHRRQTVSAGRAAAGVSVGAYSLPRSWPPISRRLLE
jgi:hypothetical protein